MTIRGRARSICVLLAALALTTSAYAAPTSAPRARSRATPAPATSRPRDSPDIETSNIDMNDVEAFLTQARDEFIATRASRGSSHGRSTTTSPNEAGLDWIASFFSPRERRRGSAGRAARNRRDSNLPPVEVDQTGVDFYLTARAYAQEHAVSDPRGGRMRIARAEEPNQFQWWYDFIWQTQQQIIACEGRESCEGLWHQFGAQGSICCDAGAEFYGHAHFSCVESVEQCEALTTCASSADCGVNQVCCATKPHSDDLMCVTSFQDCAAYCHSDAQCKAEKGEQCCYDEVLGYTICIPEGLSCPPPPPECPTTGQPACRSDSERTCCGGVCCPPDENGVEWLCCRICDENVCYRATPSLGDGSYECPDPFCPRPPECSSQAELSQCTDPVNPIVAAQSARNGDPPTGSICCGGVCCEIGDTEPIGTFGPNFCCYDFPDGPSGWSCQPGIPGDLCPTPPPGCARQPPSPQCPAGSEYLDTCVAEDQSIGVCCGPEVDGGGLTCCPDESVCCANVVDGATVGYECKAQNECQEGELCRILGDCPNSQQYSVCGSCGQGNNDCALSCQAGAGEPPNDPSWTCSTVDGCDPVADYNNGPSDATCVCNNGACGGATQCKTGGNCCACQARGPRGGVQCDNPPTVLV